ncbi:MAG: hypothetical protein JNL48_07600 [Acidobacteria bacterium]|nr:hypothetical protein [Acidobacteriota bacterium]
MPARPRVRVDARTRDQAPSHVSSVSLAAVGMAAVLMVSAAGGPAPASAQEALSGACAEMVTRQLRAWHATGPPRNEPHAGMRHWPTSALGTWVTEVRTPTTVAVLQVTPARLTRLEWTEDCVARSEERPRPVADTPRFTDADLRVLLSAGRPGLVYVWSPHLPLSVDGYAQAVAAARARGLTVHPVLAPGADRAFARASLARGALPDDALRMADSIELWFRDVHLHAPSILVFARGRIVGDAWPGFHTDSEYGAFIERALRQR